MNEIKIVFREEEKGKRRRGSLEIFNTILLVALRGANKTEIVYKTNLNFKIGKRYLDFLMSKGLITANSLHMRRKVYRTTEKGKKFIKLYRETLELIK